MNDVPGGGDSSNFGIPGDAEFGFAGFLPMHRGDRLFCCDALETLLCTTRKSRDVRFSAAIRGTADIKRAWPSHPIL